MITETIDLYEYFGIERDGAKRGTLTAIRHSQMPELGVEKERPAMLVIPGGGYVIVSEREAEPVALKFFSQGFDAFILDYDVTPVHYPAQIIQAGMAMLYLRREAENLYISQDHIAAVGFSAGGHLLGCISLLWDDPALLALFGEECEKIRPDASVYSYPVVSAEKGVAHEGSFVNFCGGVVKAEDYSLEKKVRPGVSPSFIWATTTDSAVPAENALRLYRALYTVKAEAELHLFSMGEHGLSTCDFEANSYEPDEPCIPQCRKWLDLAYEFLRVRGFTVKLR